MNSYESLASKPLEGKFLLKVRFAVSDHAMTIGEGTYLGCLKQAKTMIEFVKREHVQNRTGNTFQETYSPRGKCDVIFIHKVTDRLNRNGQPMKSGSSLWMSLEICKKEEPKSSLHGSSVYDEPLEAKEGLTNHAHLHGTLL